MGGACRAGAEPRRGAHIPRSRVRARSRDGHVHAAGEGEGEGENKRGNQARSESAERWQGDHGCRIFLSGSQT